MLEPSGSRTPARFAEAYAPLGVLAVLGFLSLRERQFLLVDDAYIAFRYAANFADGQGLVWNPGEHVEGYTNLLWVLMLSGISKLGIDLTLPAVGASFLFASATVVLTARLAHVAGAENRWARILPPLLLASNGSFVNAATSGMESTAFGFLVLLAMVWLVLARGRPRLAAPAAVCFCLACLTRPEGALVTAIALVTEFATTPGRATARVRRLAPIGAAVALVVGTHMAARVAYYGYPFPNTFYAKVIFGPWTVVRGVSHLIGFMMAGGIATLPGVRELRKRGPMQAWFAHGYCLFGLYAAYLVFIGGDHPNWYRFYVPLLPLPLVASGQWIGRKLAALSLAAVVGCGGLGLAFGERQEPVIGRFTLDQKEIVAQVASFFRNEAPPDSLVAIGAVGHVGYYARTLRILDMWGLNDVHIAHRNMPPTAVFGHDKYDLAYVARLRPDYVYVVLPIPPLGAPALPPPPVDGFDVCWPSRYFPVAVYRRNRSLDPNERGLGVAPPFERYLAPPPACKPP